MTYELGRARFILEADGDDLLKEQAVTYNEVTKEAQKLTKSLAKELKVRQGDVRSAASVLISEEKKEAAEAAKIAKAELDSRKKTTQEWLRTNQAAYQQDLAAWKRLIAERDKANKAEALNRKRTTQELLRINKQQFDEEEKQRKSRERDAQRGNQRVLGYNVKGLPGDLATIAGFGAIASGAIIVREALTTLVDATTKQEQAQRSLNAAFGGTQKLFKENADTLAAQFNLVSSEVEQATTRFGVLQNQTALTGEQIKGLTKVAIDNQAAFGGDLLEAHRSLAGAILGETEAYEKYGVVLQEGVLKSSTKLTEDERARFTTMSESEKQMIRFRIIMDEANKVQGAAAQRAKETQGGFDALNRSVDELAKAIGESLVPAAGAGAREIGLMTNALTAFVKEYKEVDKAIDEVEAARATRTIINASSSILGPILATPVTNILHQSEIRAQRELAQQQHYRDLELANIKQHHADVEKLEAARRDREETELKNARKRLEATLKQAHEAEIKQIEERKKAAEFERQTRLDALEQTHEAEIERLRVSEEARKRASELELARIQAEKDAALQAIEERRDAELERIEREKEATHNAVEERIRQWEIERDARKRTNEEIRDSTLQTIEDTRDQELERLEAAQEAREQVREIEDREIEDSIEARQRLEESTHTKTLQRLEREGEALRRASTKRLRAIEDREEKDDDRHEKRIRAIDKERDTQLEAIDREIDALEAAERRRDAIRRRRGLNQQLSDAQLELRQATGTQDPAARVAAQQRLIGAIRVGNPESIKKAQDELAEIVGQGTQAIAAAQQNLSNIQEDLRDNDIKATEDAQREKLEAEKKRIQQEKDIERDQEATRDTNRKTRLDKDKRAEQDRLDDALRKLERRVERENEQFKQTRQQTDDLTKFHARQLEDRRRDEDLAHERSVERTRKTYETQADLTRQRYEAEQENIRVTYDDEATGYIPAIRRALKESDVNYELQKEAATKRYKAEQLEITNTYDNPETGLIAVHRRMEADAALAYQAVVRTVQQEYENARQAVQRAYVAGDGKSGIIDQLDVLKEATNDKLADVLETFRLHADGLVGDKGVIKVQWEEATRQFDAYMQHVTSELERKRTIRPPSFQPGTGIQIGPDPGLPGSTTTGSDGGMGTVVLPPPTTSPSGPPPPPPPSAAMPADEVDDAFSVSFGYGAKYSGTYPSGPGWAAGSAWPGGPSHHKGVDLVAPGGIGTPIPAFHPGRVKRLAADSSGPGGNMIVIEDAQGRTHWYLHLRGYAAGIQGQQVNRGDIIGYLGETGTEGSPHLHYEVRNGDNNGPMSLADLRQNGIDPMPYVRGRDSGYLFQNPTMYEDMRTGEKGVLAERGPERLLGRKETRVFDSSGLRQQLTQSPVAARNPLDYSMLGSSLLGMPSTTSISHGGDTMVYHGVAPENLIKQWRADQRKQRVLKGVRKIG